MRFARVLTLLFLGVAACTDGATAPEKLKLDPSTASASADPHPEAPGLWLGGRDWQTWDDLSPPISPSRCFKDVNPNINDSDYDWLDQSCELYLARAFAPYFRYANGEPCADGEPAWAVKYFPNQGVVRIAYLMAYYRDCPPWWSFAGSTGHSGDSEMIMVEVKYDAASQHWQFFRMWLSAHYQAGYDRSTWQDYPDVDFPQYSNFGQYLDNRPLGFPQIWASKFKHANYRSHAACDALDNFEKCPEGGQARRLLIDANRNVGSRFRDLMGCVLSVVPSRAANGRRECFYAESRRFAGWNIDSDVAGSYREMLMSEKFEQYGSDWGPGSPPPPPPPPPPPAPSATIFGPDEAPAGESCNFQVATNFDAYHYEWSVDGWVISNEPTVWVSRYDSYTLEVRVWSEDGAQSAITSKYVNVSWGAGGCWTQ